VASGLILLGAREGWTIDEERQRFPPGRLTVTGAATPIRVDDALGHRF
jgi:hypothetical protein